MLKGVRSNEEPEVVFGTNARLLFGIKDDYKSHKPRLKKNEHLYARCFVDTASVTYVCIDNEDVFKALMIPIAVLGSFSSTEIWAVPDSVHRKIKGLP